MKLDYLAHVIANANIFDTCVIINTCGVQWPSGLGVGVVLQWHTSGIPVSRRYPVQTQSSAWQKICVSIGSLSRNEYLAIDSDGNVSE